MSASYTSILWNKQKRRYDLGLGIMILIFVIAFFVAHTLWHPDATFETVFIRAFGWLAILLLHAILVIGPLSRIHSGFLIVLYNRRHLGVTMFVTGAIHGVFSIMNFHALGDTNPVRSVFVSNLNYNDLTTFPFQVLGFIGLLILAFMAASSHDFWLKNLGPKTWKALHMMVYVAYGLLIFHVILGGLQNETNPLIFQALMFGFTSVTVLHLWSGLKERKMDFPITIDPEVDFVYACDLQEIPENRAKIVTISSERVAIFKYQGQLSAVSNVCRHQGGPIGEGKIVEGCITCPWHGYQYLPANGQSPPPFEEKLETYYLKVKDQQVLIKPEPNKPGTPVKPVKV